MVDVATESPVLHLQDIARDGRVPVSDLLRYAKSIAMKLNITDAHGWIDDELDGYMSGTKNDVPEYRWLNGCWQGQDQYGYWKDIVFSREQDRAAVCKAPVGYAIGMLEQLHKNNEALAFSGIEEIRAMIIRGGVIVDARWRVGSAQIWTIIERVRNIVLNWALQLEQAGVTGEGFQIAQRERSNSSAMSKQYFIQNVGVIGDVSGGSMTNQQRASLGVDLSAIAEAIRQARHYLPDLPPTTAHALKPAIDELEREAPTASPSRMKELLGSIRTILEGAAGTVVAEGLKAIFRMLI